VIGVDGISDFDALHSRQHDVEVQLYAFDCLAYNGDDLISLPPLRPEAPWAVSVAGADPFAKR
jgi:hypothetical protein